MADRLFSTITVRYLIKDKKNPDRLMAREITEVHDACVQVPALLKG